MQFVHQALTWGFLLALVPLLIHLINMMRHKRVKWAAMDFLLQSYKKHRKWVWLKQFLLMLMRMLAIALVVAMLAQWKTRDQWLELFGGKATHHFVLLDDSYSMSDRSGAVTASDTARQVVGRIVARAAEPDNFIQKFTLLRYSKANRATGMDAAAKIAQVADFNAEIIDTNFATQLEDKRNIFEVTQLSSGPRDAVVLLKQLLEKGSKDQNVIYVVSDFRANQWDAPKELSVALKDLEKSGAEVHLVDCVKTAQQNLGIVEIKPTEDTRAAGVPLYVTIDVKNYGTTIVKNVQLKVRTIYYPPELTESGDPESAAGIVDELPTVLLEEIKPGATTQARVQVYFPKPGQHAVEAVLPEDTVAADNRRWCVVDFPDGEAVLLVDGSVQQNSSYYLASVFQPGARANTGIRPTIQKPAYLRDVSPRDLNAYRAIYLMDVDRLEQRMVENLEAFMRAGGGVAVFVGENMSLANYTQQFYRDGEGAFPLPLQRIDNLPPEAVDNVADIEVTDHPVFRAFLGEANPFIRLVTIERYVRPPTEWSVPADSTVKVVARLRNRQPLVVERQFGEGRLMVFLTTLTPLWNNWAGDPSFIVTQLKLQSYLASTKRTDETHLVGAPLQVSLESDKYKPEIKFVVPGAKASTRVIVERTAVPPKEKSSLLQTALGKSGDMLDDDVNRAGIYEAWATTLAGTVESRRYAVNVETTEGDLGILGSSDLLTKLEPARPKFHDADAFDSELGEQSGFNRSLFLMALLLLLLVGEQFLAYTVSYHPPLLPATSAPGVVR